jgi:hypothetical protein
MHNNLNGPSNNKLVNNSRSRKDPWLRIFKKIVVASFIKKNANVVADMIN